MSLLYRAIQSHIKDFESSLYTTMPAKVLEFDPVECTVKVQPSIDEIDLDGLVRRIPEIERVPLVLPSALNSAITFPVKPEDKVLLHFAHSNIENFLLQRTETPPISVTPSTRRKHDLDDCFATLGVRFYDDSPVRRNDTLDMYFNDTRLTFSEDGKLEITNETEGSKIELKADGNIEVITKEKIAVRNGSVELIALLSDLINTLVGTTVNTTYGLSPLNSRPALQALKDQLDTMKE